MNKLLPKVLLRPNTFVQKVLEAIYTSRTTWTASYLRGRGGEILHQMFGSQVQHAKIYLTQLDLRFC